MSSIESISSSYNELILAQLLNAQNTQSSSSSILDETTLTNLVNGEYDITLEEYTSMNTYRTMMNALFGDSSSNTFNSTLNTILGNSSDSTATAKDFLDKMEELGVSNGSAIKLYTALKTYSITSSIFQKNSYVSAKI